MQIEWVLFCSPPPARPWRYGITPAAETTTVALWVDTGTDSWPNSVIGEKKEGKETNYTVVMEKKIWERYKIQHRGTRCQIKM